MAAPTVVFVPPAFALDAAWWWHRADELLAERGIASRTVDLPSCGPEGPLEDLYADVAAVREAIDAVGGPVVLVGHSYAGVVITDAAAGHPEVRHLVYIAAAVPDGKSIVDSEFIPPDRAESIGEEYDIREDGTAGESLEAVRTGMLAGLDPELIEEGLKRRGRQSLATFMQPPEAAAWKDIPSTYLLCLEDVDVPAEIQREHAKRCGSVVELPTNHFAYLERPELVADAVAAVAEPVAAR